MKQERTIVVLPKTLKRAMKSRALDTGKTMRLYLIHLIEGDVGEDWRMEDGERILLPGEQRLFAEEE